VSVPVASSAEIEAMRGRLRVFAQYDSDVRESADVVVVGSGPAGSVVAYELAAAGHDVILLEEGPPFIPREFEVEGGLSMARTMRESGLRMTTGSIMPTMQAICLGGGSLVNSAICVRPPPFVFEAWSELFELEHTTRAELEPHYDAVGEFLGIAPTPENVLGPRNTLFRDGCDALGISSEPISRNVRGCRGTGECFTGCRNRAKQSMDISYIPEALRLGARVFTSAQVQRIRWDGTAVSGVVGQVVEPFTGKRSHKLRFDAKIVVLAAGCMATPVLLQKSGDLANRSGQVGENLQFHPGVAIAGVFPEPIDVQFGATQGYQSLEFLDRGFKLESLWAPPAVMAVRTPGFGHELLQHFADIPRTAAWDAICSTHRSTGSVRARRGATLDPALRWNMHPDDVPLLREALHTVARLFFAAGAEHILPGIARLSPIMYSEDEASVLLTDAVQGRDLVTGGNHVFSTTRMHGRGEEGVVDELGRCHDVDNLYIADTGIFPRCPSVNPMYTAMALARRQALAICDRL
jgi:choline dehydrogenase-like flavoprotein